MTRPPLDIAAIARWNAAQRASRLAYRAHCEQLDRPVCFGVTGTITGTRRHYDAHERACPPCGLARSDYDRARNARRRAAKRAA